MRILYLHGLGSSSNSSTFKYLKEVLDGHELYGIEIPDNPVEALNCIKSFYLDKKINLIIGTSLGGFYAMNVKGPAKIVINPALHPSKEIPKLINIGEEIVRFSYTSEDNKTFMITEKDIEDFRSIESELYDNIDSEDTYCTYALFGTKDDIVTDKEEFSKIFRKYRIREAEFGHRLTEQVIDDDLVRIINEVILNMDKEFVL